MGMSDLASGAVGSGHNLSIHNDAAADAGSQGYQDQVFIALASAFPAFSKCRHVCIISGLCVDACHFFHLFNDIYLAPVKVDRYRNDAGFADRSRNTDPDAGDLFLSQSSIRHLRKHRLCRIRKNVFSVFFRTSLDLPLIQDIPCPVKKPEFNRRPSDINSKTIVFNLLRCHEIIPPCVFSYFS